MFNVLQLELNKTYGVKINTKYFCLLNIILIAMLLAGGCSITDTNPPPPKLEIVDHSLSLGDVGNATVLITVNNTGSSVLELAEVRVNFLVSQGNPIESSKDAVMNLKSGEIWDFTIRCQDIGCNKVKDYEIETFPGSTSGIRPY